jgi:hypothetical protein
VVGGDALAAVAGDRPAELDVVDDVAPRKRHPAAIGVLDGEPAVAVDGDDGPELAVPPGDAPVGSLTGVAAGGDLITDVGGGAVGEADAGCVVGAALELDGPVDRPGSLDPGGGDRHRGAVGRQVAVHAGDPVGEQGGVDGVKPAVLGVGGDGGRFTGPQSLGWRRLATVR